MNFIGGTVWAQGKMGGLVINILLKVPQVTNTPPGWEPPELAKPRSHPNQTQTRSFSCHPHTTADLRASTDLQGSLAAGWTRLHGRFHSAHELRMVCAFFLMTGKNIRGFRDVKTFTIWSVRENSANFV